MYLICHPSNPRVGNDQSLIQGYVFGCIREVLGSKLGRDKDYPSWEER
jgi:hypothetical protein